jgi:uncharacterized protein (TIGR03790 family)
VRQLIFVLLFVFSLGEAGCVRAGTSAADLANATIVVYNRAAPDSPGLARFYAAQRHIPNDHVVGLECSTEEEISRQEYDETIAAPLRKIFAERKWWTLRNGDGSAPVVTSRQITFVVLIRGIPLKIRATATYPGDQTGSNLIASQNQASVDSELTLLGLFSKQISGAAANPYFQSFRAIAEVDDSPILLVCRLDGPSAEVVRRMITDAVETEKTGLWGRSYVDGAHNTGGGLADGDQWLETAVKDLRRVGIPVVYDEKPATFPAGYPMSDCALYYGWYAGNVCGPFTDPGFSFRRGAIAVHIHSFSASTLRHAGAGWVGPLLSKGAAASLGNVYEPYLQMTAHLDIFNDRLLHGFTLAESAYMATRALSWMGVVVGDPLYRPYASWMQLDANRAAKNNWEAYHDFATKNAGKDRAEYLALARRAAARTDNGPMIEDLGLMQKEAGDFAGAISCLQQARTIYKQRGDLLRVVLEQADALVQSGRKEEALALVHSVSRVVSDLPLSTLLRKKEEELNPPTPTPALSPMPTR